MRASGNAVGSRGEADPGADAYCEGMKGRPIGSSLPSWDKRGKMGKTAVVTGCGGFIGSNLVDRLVSEGYSVIGVDNFSTGQRRFLEGSTGKPNFRLTETDILDLDALKVALAGADEVYHLAANADVRFGTEHPRKDLEQNTIATYNVLEAMRANSIKKLAFSSTGSVYGEALVFPTPEDAPFPVQTSLYGASKAAGEGLISAYCEGFGFEACIFRFVSILGERYTHGHVFDFYQQLKADPKTLKVLGNGRQRKSYLYVQDCIDAMLLAMAHARDKANIYNLGVDNYCEVNDSIGWICEAVGASPSIVYSGGDRGWIGDNPFIFLDNTKIRALGWSPKLTIKQGVLKTVEFLRANEWVYEARQ
jgi:UDP-glucose 4-epimerase